MCATSYWLQTDFGEVGLTTGGFRANAELVIMGNRLLGIAMMIGITILSMVCSVDDAWAQRKEKRMALVVGNSNYANVPKLPNPQRDAISVGQMLRDAGFDNVEVIVNASNLEFKRAIRKFEVDVNQADIAVVYYAGHGLDTGRVAEGSHRTAGVAHLHRPGGAKYLLAALSIAARRAV